MRALRTAALALWLAAPAAAQQAGGWAPVAALLESRCTLCHAGEAAPLGLDLGTRAGLMAGSANGPVVVPGAPGDSELVRRLTGESMPRMPMTGPPWLTADEVALVAGWIAAGAPGPAAAAAPAAAGPPALPGPGETVTFAHVERIFRARCAKCHTEGGLMGPPPEGLRLDGYAAILTGAERLALVPGRPGMSEIIRRIEGTATPRMPFDGPPWLPQAEAAAIRAWIAQGARDADGAPAPLPAGREVRLRGRMTGPAEIDGAGFAIGPGTRIDDRPAPGQAAEMRGVVAADGRVRATRLRAR